MNNTKEIKYNGYTAQPSDYESTDGDLALAIGVVPENGALHPVMSPRVLACFGDNVERVFIHNNNFSHYIVILDDDDGNKNFVFYDYDAEEFGEVSDAFLTISGEDIVDITAVGNTLIVASDKKMYYLLWARDGYRLLGNEIPGAEVAFALKGEVMSHTYTDKNISTAESATTTADEGWKTIAQVSYKFDDVLASSFSDYQDLDKAITLKKNTNYALSTAYTSDRGAYTWYLEGVREDDEQYHVIFHGAPRSTAKHYTITTKYGYSDLRIKVYNNYSGSSQHETFSNVLIIEEGNSSSVTLKYTIKNDSDNFTALLGITNSFVNKYATQKGKFIFPFFVRYALKLFDGSYARISEPILMIPNSSPVLLHFFPHQQNEGNTDVAAYAFICSLQWRIVNGIGSEWEDIVKGVDIFVSPPIYTYRQGQNYDSSDDTLFTYKVFDAEAGINELQGLDHGNLNLYYTGTPVDEYYSHRDLYGTLTRFYSFADTQVSSQWRCVLVAPKSDEQIRKDIIETSNCYRVKSMNFEEIKETSGFTDIELADGVLENLVNRQSLDDEILANRTLVTAHMYAYNNRLHAFDATLRLPTPRNILLSNAFVSPNGMSCCYTYVFLHTADGTKVVCHTAPSELEGAFNRYGLSWFFYPDNNAYRVLFVSKDKSMYLDLQLTTHDFLNGAYWLADSLNEEFAPHLYGNEFQVSTAKSEDTQSETQDMIVTNVPYPVPDVDDCIRAPAVIYVSEVNDVFAFRAAMAVSVGCCRVMALAAAARPMSSGQFGQFPLYAFTDNGVWSLETAPSGSYVARQPITRDVCANPRSICQLDSSVLFASDRGVMELAGAAANCITDDVDTQFPFCASDLEQFDSLVGIFNRRIVGSGSTIDADDIAVLPFKEFAKGCRILYDYVHQRVIFYNTNVRYAYVFSRLSSHWGMTLSNSVLNVNAYPYAQAIDAHGNLVEFSATDEERAPVFIVTRPFALGLPDVHKTIDTIMQRGFCRDGGFGQVLYASNDMFRWVPVAQSADMFLGGFSGSAYKYFRLVLVGDIAKDESVYGCSVSYRKKLDNKLR